MKRWKRVVAGFIVGLVVLVAGAFMSVDAIAKSLVQSQGTQLLGVTTTVDSVSVGVLKTPTVVRGLTVANPEGFARPTFAAIGSATIDASLTTLTSRDIEIPSVIVDGLTLDLEQVNDRLNADVIVAHIGAAGKPNGEGDAPAGDTTADSAGSSLNIKRLEIRNIHLHAEGSIVNIAGGILNAEVPSFVLENVGTSSDDSEIAEELVSLTVGIVLQHIAENPVKGLSNATVGSIASAIEVIPGLKQVGVSKVLLDVHRGVHEGLEQATHGIGEAVGNLLGGGKKKDDGPSKDAD